MVDKMGSGAFVQVRKSMRIWHVGASSSPYRVDGVSRTVWSLSRQQAHLGHEVTLLTDTPPDDAGVQMARAANLKLIDVRATAFSYRSEVRRIIEREKPQIVHMHSVFVVRQATLGRVLNQMAIPYIITPHAGLAPQVLKRGVVKKTLYSFFRERPRFEGAAAIALVTPNEERAVRSFLPNYRHPIQWMPNPIDIDHFEHHRWQGLQPVKRVVFMGRFDVLVKGIDVLVETARLLPDIRFDLYGTEDHKTLDWLNRLKSNLPANVEFHEPIFGDAKAKMLSNASLYLQPSRWEGFPVSVAECLFLGVPCAVADTLDMAQMFRQYDLGPVIPLDPPRAAEVIRAAMGDEPRLWECVRRGQEFSLRHFHPLAAAQNYIGLYEQVLSRVAQTRVESPPRRLIPASLRSNVKSSIAGLMNRASRLVGSIDQPRTIVLCYHSIRSAAADLSVDPSVFRRQLEMLKSAGYGFLDFRGLLDVLMREGSPRRNVACITFDDGYEDNLTHAAPILLDMKIPATMFITSGLMLGEEPVISRFHRLTKYESRYLSSSQVRELSHLGFEIGSHTHSHPNLAMLSADQTWDELHHSRRLIEEATGTGLRSFAYPFGKRGLHYTPTTVSVVRESGLSGAAAVAFRAVNASQHVRIFEMPRFFVNRSDTEESFEQKVRGDYDWLGLMQQGTPAWMRGIVSPEERYA